MTKNEIVTEIDVQCKQAKHTIRRALQFPKLATQQDEIENARRTLNALYTSCATLSMRSQTT